MRQALDAAVEARIACEKTLAEARNAVEAAAGALRELEEARLQVEPRVAPLRERIGELRLKEQAAQLNFEQFAHAAAEAGADEARARRPQAEDAPRPSPLQGEITRLNAGDRRARRGQPGRARGARDAAASARATSTRRPPTWTRRSTTLEDAIRRIDRETRELLRETFDEREPAFRRSCSRRCSAAARRKLVMTGEEILDAGVQVMAQPPGKRNTSIHLLSGGEKALTAISLVFALFQLNPAPFCLLDEVDAPLDDTNTERFCDLVEAHVGADAVPVHQPQQDHHGDGRAADRRHHARAGRVARGGGGHRGGAAHPGGAGRLRAPA